MKVQISTNQDSNVSISNSFLRKKVRTRKRHQLEQEQMQQTQDDMDLAVNDDFPRSRKPRTPKSLNKFKHEEMLKLLMPLLSSKEGRELQEAIHRKDPARIERAFRKLSEKVKQDVV